MEEIKLKPCPFCGGEAEFNIKTNSSSRLRSGFTFVIRCKECHIQYPKMYRSEFKIHSNGDMIPTIDERGKAADDWNRRAGEIYDKEVCIAQRDLNELEKNNGL